VREHRAPQLHGHHDIDKCVYEAEEMASGEKVVFAGSGDPAGLCSRALVFEGRLATAPQLDHRSLEQRPLPDRSTSAGAPGVALRFERPTLCKSPSSPQPSPGRSRSVRVTFRAGGHGDSLHSCAPGDAGAGALDPQVPATGWRSYTCCAVQSRDNAVAVFLAPFASISAKSPPLYSITTPRRCP